MMMIQEKTRMKSRQSVMKTVQSSSSKNNNGVIQKTTTVIHIYIIVPMDIYPYTLKQYGGFMCISRLCKVLEREEKRCLNVTGQIAHLVNVGGVFEQTKSSSNSVEQGGGENNSNEGGGANNGRRIFFIGGEEVITLLAKFASIN
jgi:hypothetical protein